MVSVEGVPDYCEIILIEFSIKTRKWLCTGLYKPPSQFVSFMRTFDMECWIKKPTCFQSANPN